MKPHRFPNLAHFLWSFLSLHPECRNCGYDFTTKKMPTVIHLDGRVEYTEEEIDQMTKGQLLRLMKAGYRMWLDGDSMAGGDYWVLRKD